MAFPKVCAAEPDAEAGDHFIEDQQHAVVMAELADAFEVTG